MFRPAFRLAGLTLATLAVAPPAAAQDQARTVSGGGISVAGWMGQVDANEAARGQLITNSKFAREGEGFRVTTGPAAVYWHPDNRASGNYEVSARFHEPEYMNVNDHPHPYGIVIGGSDLGTPNARYLYCAAYGNGTFIVRGFGPAAFQVNGRRGEANPAVNRAAAKGQPVTQEIRVVVHGDRVTCSINGTEVGNYAKADLVGDGKLTSTDGLWGVRFAHNTDAVVTGLRMTRH
jgi:hypothetical protein